MNTKNNKIRKRAFVGMEAGLKEASEKFIGWNKQNTHEIRDLVERITRRIIEAMKKESSIFRRLYRKYFLGGSIYEALKVGKPDELDIDILLELEGAKPNLKEDTNSGFVQLKLENFGKLARTDPDLYKGLSKFVDYGNYLLTSGIKSFMQSIFDQTLNDYFPRNIVKIGKRKFKIAKIQRLGPAFTLSIEGAIPFTLSVDLVPCILLTQKNWPQKGFKSNPYPNLEEFFIVPKEPNNKGPRHWRLSFQMQEKMIIYNRFWMKAAIRFMKRIRDHFGQNVASYGIKTMFIWELYRENPALDGNTPDLWTKYPLSYLVVYMLGKYLEYLEAGKIPYFWNSKLNLLDSLNEQQIRDFKGQIANMFEDITANPTPKTILKYMS